MPQIRPITDLRNTNEISDLCHASREPIFITKNGYGDLVVMSIETYEAMVENARGGHRDCASGGPVSAGRTAPRREGGAGFFKEEALWINTASN